MDTCRMHRHASARVAAAGEPPVACTAETRAATIVVLPDVFGRFLGERALGAPGLDAHGTPWFLASRVPGCGAGAGAAFGEVGPRVLLVKPRGGAVFHADEAPVSADVVEVIAATEGMPDGTALDVLVDGEVRASMALPYRALVPITRGEHAVEVRPRDAKVTGRVARAEISVR